MRIIYHLSQCLSALAPSVQRVACFATLLLLISSNLNAQTVVLEFYDDETGEPVAARFKWAPKSPKLTKPRTLLNYGDWWLATPDFSVTPREKDYEFLVQRGPEFTNIRGGFTFERNSRDVVEVEIPRSTYMRTEKWYSADHSVQLPQGQAERWQRADAVDLISLPHHLASRAVSGKPDASGAPTSQNVTENKTQGSERSPSPSSSRTPPKKPNSKSTPVYERLVESKDPILSGEQLSAYHETLNEKHGRFRIHSLTPIQSNTPENIPQSAAAEQDSVEGKQGNQRPTPNDSQQESPKSFTEAMNQLISSASRNDSWVELIDPWSRDVPILLATGQIHAVQILSSGARPDSDEQMATRSPQDPETKPFARIQRNFIQGKSTNFVFAPFPTKDRILFKGGQATGRLTEATYWQMLETGLKLTATAGTDFGLADTHLGYNRTYFYSPVPPSPQIWVDAIKNGEVVTTNGPLLRPFLNGHPPGATHTGNGQDGVELNIDLSLTVREHVDYLDVVFNSQTLYSAKLEDHYKNGEFPPLKITESGWLVIRIVTTHDKGYRVATSAPVYFSIDSSPRISSKAVQFMQAWLENAELDIRDKGQWDDYEPWVKSAKDFWRNRLSQATAP